MKPLRTGLQRVLLQRQRRIVSAETDTFSLLSAAQFKIENTKKVLCCIGVIKSDGYC